MARSLRFLVTSASVLAVMSCAGAGYAQTTQKDIIWNDPASPAASAAAPVAPTNTAPIRDDYANPPQPPQNLVTPPPPPQSSNQGIIWNEPSASPNANAGNANTSVHTIAPRPPVSASAAPLPPGAAGPCREYTQDVVIDGRHTTAHGHACRQPDGSWRIID